MPPLRRTCLPRPDTQLGRSASDHDADGTYADPGIYLVFGGSTTSRKCGRSLCNDDNFPDLSVLYRLAADLPAWCQRPVPTGLAAKANQAAVARGFSPLAPLRGALVRINRVPTARGRHHKFYVACNDLPDRVVRYLSVSAQQCSVSWFPGSSRLPTASTVVRLTDFGLLRRGGIKWTKKTGGPVASVS
jgi:hypothetical protein